MALSALGSSIHSEMEKTNFICDPSVINPILVSHILYEALKWQQRHSYLYF